jgi:hypothetical protein
MKHLILLIIATLLLAPVLQAQSMKPGLGFVTSASGKIEAFDQDGKKTKIKLHKTLNLDGLSLNTKNNGKVFLVLSNGVALALNENTQIIFKEFEQIPFPEGDNNFRHEPTISNLIIEVIDGTIGLTCDHLSPLSNLQVLMNSGHVRVHSTTSVISVNSLGMNISAFEGTLTFYYPDGKEREFIAQPETVRISDQSAARGIVTEGGTIEDKESEIKKLATDVKFARERVFFRAVKGSDVPEPIIIVPANYLETVPVRPFSFQDSPIP